MRNFINIKLNQTSLRKSKIGFATPEKMWLEKKKEFFINIINENRKFLEKYINVDMVIEDFRNGKKFKENFLIWRIINLGLWGKVYFSNINN